MVKTSKGEVEKGTKKEKTLMRYERRFRLMFENAAEGILLADAEKKKFCQGNKHFRETLGYSLEEIKSLSVRDIHPRRDLFYVLDQFDKLVRREIAVAKDIPVKRKDGSLFYADISALSITQRGKIYVIGIFRDITGRKELSMTEGYHS